MDLYHAWCDLKPGVGDVDFSERVAAYMGHLKAQGLIEGWRLTRRKLGLGQPGLGEFHLMIETTDLAQLEFRLRPCRGARRAGRGLPFRRQLPRAERPFRALPRFPRPVQDPRQRAVLTARPNHFGPLSQKVEFVSRDGEACFVMHARA